MSVSMGQRWVLWHLRHWKCVVRIPGAHKMNMGGHMYKAVKNFEEKVKEKSFQKVIILFVDLTLFNDFSSFLSVC